jgi:prepilin-type N-terminal cleavage/methylation domain-containing protein
MIRTFRKAHRGFTLVETLIAITIIMVVMVEPFKLVENSLTSSYVSRDELIANSLAQEGVEYVRHVRDTLYLATYPAPESTTWLQGFDGTGGGAAIDCRFPKLCTVDPTPIASTPVVVCFNGATNTCAAVPLYVSTPSSSSYPYLYNQAYNGTPTRFYRTVQICYLGNGSCTTLSNEAQVTVIVTWVSGHQTNTTKVVEYLQNWL